MAESRCFQYLSWNVSNSWGLSSIVHFEPVNSVSRVRKSAWLIDCFISGNRSSKFYKFTSSVYLFFTSELNAPQILFISLKYFNTTPCIDMSLYPNLYMLSMHYCLQYHSLFLYQNLKLLHLKFIYSIANYLCPFSISWA